MRLKHLMFATALLVAVPGTAVAAPARPTALPHPVGGVISPAGRTVAKSGVRALDVLPASVDLREYAPSPGNQGQIGACVAWTVGYSIMGYWANRTGGAGAPYAPLYLYMRNVAKGGAPAAGLIPDYVLANAQAAGIDTQDDYWQGTTNWQEAPSPAQVDNAKNYKVSGWTRLFNGSNQGAGAQTAIMQSLASGNPVGLAIPVFRDFMYLRQHSLYTTTSGSNLGGHMVAVYGYDAQGVFIRNSWGTGWGNGGDGKLSWAFIQKAATGAYSVSGVTTPATAVLPTPSVAALSTAKAATGTKVTITGSSLAGAGSVSFGGTSATFEPLVTGGVTKLVATAPAHATGLVDVTVTNASGTSVASKASKFTYIPPAPGITKLDPSTVTVLGGQTVTLTGSDLAGVTSVKIGTVPAQATKVTASSLTFTTPVRPAGTYPVTVTNTWGTSNPAGQLTYVLPPAPVVGTVAPASGPTYKSTAVVLTGTDFAGATKMTLDGRTVGFTKVSGSQVKLTLPAHAAGDGVLQITTPGGTSTGAFTWTAPPVPVITALSTPAGSTRTATTVLLTGTGLTDASKVLLGTTPIGFTRISETQVRVTVPARPAGTATTLSVVTPGGTSTGTAFNFA